jgi:hypothetical protein
MSDIKNWKEERLILVHSFRGFSPQLLGLMCIGRTSWWQEPVAGEVLYLMMDRKQSGGGVKWPGTRYSDLLPPARCPLLKFSPLPKIMPPLGD